MNQYKSFKSILNTPNTSNTSNTSTTHNINNKNKSTTSTIYDVKYENLDILAIPVESNKDGSLILTLNSQGDMSSISEFINGKYYDVVSVLCFPISKNYSENKKYYLVNKNSFIKEENTVSIISSIYEIDIYNNSNLPMLYYDGELLNSLPHGNGNLYSNGKLKYSGKFEKGNIINGMMFNFETSSRDGSYMSYSGSFKEGIPHGEGIYYNKVGVKVYEGQISDGKYNGNGTSYWESSGAKNWEGKWSNNQKHGHGRLFDDNDCLICNCMFEHDQMSFIE